jgi:8-oxo-dGTP diphosphatase
MSRSQLHVAAAVIENDRGEILLAKRPTHLDQGGLWEFPGGKLESGEAVFDTLQRELEEELGIQVSAAHPLIRIPWSYPEREVLLDVWRVTAFAGEARGMEGQLLAWVPAAQLSGYSFPAANAAIVTAAQLPHRYHISPDPGEAAAWPEFLQQLEQTLRGGARLLQLRAKQLEPPQYAQLASEVIRRCHAHGAQCLLNAPAELVLELGADGVHLDSGSLRACSKRPLPARMWVAASCHSLAELQQAMRIGASFALMSPVKPTASHPGASVIGWEGFAAMADQAAIPLYALGGMLPGDELDAWRHGGQGIAAIRALWQS